MCEVWRPCFAEEETVPMEEVECRLVAIVDGLSFTLVRGITWRVSGGVEVPGVTAPDVKVRARSW